MSVKKNKRLRLLINRGSRFVTFIEKEVFTVSLKHVISLILTTSFKVVLRCGLT
jgi:hypothetical protein